MLQQQHQKQINAHQRVGLVHYVDQNAHKVISEIFGLDWPKSESNYCVGICHQSVFYIMGCNQWL